MVESGRVPGKGRIKASIEKLFRGVPKNGRISVSTEKWKNRGEYRAKIESVRVLKNCPDEYRKPGEYLKKVESEQISKNCPEDYKKNVESV